MLELDKLYNVDCMQGMKEFPDKYFDLAIVDPPYGINATKKSIFAQRKAIWERPCGFGKMYIQRMGQATTARRIFHRAYAGKQKSNHLGRKSFYKPNPL